MKFKLDENIGALGKSRLEADGHDVMTVTEQQLGGRTNASTRLAAAKAACS